MTPPPVWSARGGPIASQSLQTGGGVKVIALLLVAVFLVLGGVLIVRTSPTTDEVAFHMVNGYTYLVARDFRMSPANPPLLREWMALPWLLLRPALDLEKTSWKEADSVPFGQEFFYKDNRAMADRLLYSSRAMILLLGAALGWVVYLWSRALYGGGGGLLSLSLYVFSPVFLGFSSIAHTDVGVTLFTTLTAYFVWRYLKYSRKADKWGMAVSFGLACVAKYNALFFAPFFFVALVSKKGLGRTLKLVPFATVVSFLVIWAAYFFEVKPILSEGVPRIEEKLAMLGNPFLQKAALEWPVPAPSFWLGVAGIARGHQAPYLHYSPEGWTTDVIWYSYLLSFAFKMTLPFLIALLLRTLCFKRCSAGSENFLLLVPTAALFVLTSFDSTGVGVRYLLPVVTLLMVWAGGAAKLAASKTGKMLVVWLAVWNAAIGLSAFPNALSYMNALVGGAENGYRYLRGSDMDWGQGLKGLKRYQDEKSTGKLTLEYFGTADPSFYGLNYEVWTEAERLKPEKKIYAISATYLEHAKWASSFKPDALVDGCIFIYDLRSRA
jgi:hypothetical protein